MSSSGVILTVEQGDPATAVNTGHEVTRMGRRAASGAIWVLLASGAARALGFASSLVLARLLAPSDFGLVAFAMIMIGAFNLLQGLGVPAAIVYGARDVKQVGGTALSINLGAATLLFVVTIIVSPFLAALGGDGAIAPVVTALAFGLVIASFGSVQEALLVKELAFRRKLVPDVLPLVASGVASILLALLGFGVWSLVLGYLAKNLASTLVLWSFSSVRPWPEFKWPIAVEMLRYGGHVSFASVTGFVINNVDYFIIGAMLGTHELGIYTMAFMLANIVAGLSHAVSVVTFPAFSRLRGDKASLLEMSNDVFNIIWSISLPACVAMFVCAPAFITIVLGEKWAAAIEPMKVLTVFAALRALQIFTSVYRSVGRPDFVWKIQLIRLLITLPLMLFAVRYGILSIALVHAPILAFTWALHAVVLDRYVGVPIGQFWRCMWPGLVGAAVMGLIIGAAYALDGTGANSLGPLGSAILAAIALAAYVAVQVGLNPRLTFLGQAGLAAVVGSRR